MKKHFALFLFLFFSLCTPLFVMSQQGNWVWAKAAAGNSTDEGYSVSADHLGNVYVCGYFGGSSITFGSDTLANNGSADIFIAKYDTSGNVIWAKSAGGNNSDEALSVKADHLGNIYLAGYFNSNSITFGNITLTNNGFSDFFIVKYDSSGNVLWAKSAGGANIDEGYSVSTDNSDNVIVNGFFNSPSLAIGSFTLINSGSYDCFIAKFDPSGNVLWARSAGGSSFDESFSVTTDTSGNIFASGYFNSSAIAFGSFTLTNAGSTDFFIVKYDSSGNELWAKSAGGVNLDQGYSLATDPWGNVCATGYFCSPTINFGNVTLTNAGTYDFFIVKYDPSGNVLWAKSAGGTGDEKGYSLSTDDAGNIYATGKFTSPSISFGSAGVMTPAGSSDPMFIVKFDSSGTALCAAALASGGDDQAGVSVDHYGDAYLTGDFIVNPFIIGSDTLTESGYETVFTARYSCSLLEATNETTGYSRIIISPNPTSGIFTITTNLKTNFSVQIFNALGMLVHSAPCTVHSAPGTLDLSDQPDGIYFVRIISDGKMFAQKVIKE